MECVRYEVTYIWFSHLVAVFPVLFLSSWSVRCWSLEESAMVGNWKRQFPGHLKPHHMTVLLTGALELSALENRREVTGC